MQCCILAGTCHTFSNFSRKAPCCAGSSSWGTGFPMLLGVPFWVYPSAFRPGSRRVLLFVSLASFHFTWPRFGGLCLRLLLPSIFAHAPFGLDERVLVVLFERLPRRALVFSTSLFPDPRGVGLHRYSGSNASTVSACTSMFHCFVQASFFSCAAFRTPSNYRMQRLIASRPGCQHPWDNLPIPSSGFSCAAHQADTSAPGNPV